MAEEIKKRKVMLVIEDDGDSKFSFRLEGDIERLSNPIVSPGMYSAAEFWGLEFLKLCTERLKQGNGVKKMNREERRKSDATAT